jgi:putative CocE/NonD family hydrolase
MTLLRNSMIARTSYRLIKLAALLILLPLLVQAQSSPPDPPAGFDKIEQMIPMRDGVKLHTIIYTPKSRSGPLPILFNRTPYGIDGLYRVFPGGILKELIDDGYIFAFQDIRGRFKSEGQFVMLRPLREAGNPIDETTDTYDSIEWMIKNVPENNGRVGMFGTSYPGWLVVMAVIDPHPALKAVIEEATPADMYLGDDFHHNGAFRLS